MDEEYMKEALLEAKKALNLGEVPVGAIIVKNGKIIARSHNLVESEKSALKHAEVLAIKEASEYIGDWRLEGCTMYVSLEPCCMCAGAIVNSRISRLVYGASDVQRGFCGSIINVLDDGAFNHRLEHTKGVLEKEASDLLKAFFKSLREKKK